MLNFTHRGSKHVCDDGITRRDFLQVGTLGAIGLSLPQLLAAQAHAPTPTNDRSCIMIFNLGAPSQLDTCDMKPDAPAEIRGPFKPITTNVAGHPDLRDLPAARQASPTSSRSSAACYHTAAAVHDTGHQMMQTGRLFTGGINTPHAGCALALSARPQDRPAGPRDAARADGPHRRQPAARPGRRLPGQGPRSVRADGRSVEAEFQGARPAAAAGDRRGPARPPPQAARHRRRDGRRTSRPATTPSCWTATSRRPSA